MFLYPLFANWVWGGGWMATLGKNFGIGHGVVDFAGSAVVHSMGGMLAMRYALSFPDSLSGLVLVNPIGLEDWRAAGIPPRTVDQWYAGELRTSFEGIKAYQQKTYYAGTWSPDYDRWVAMLAGMYAGEGKAAVAWNQALTSDMVFTQPVVHELGFIRAPTLLLIGEKDNTAIGKDAAPPEVKKQVGNYAKLGPAAAAPCRAPN